MIVLGGERQGVHGPAELIPACEATGLILPLGRWILEQAFSQAVAWQERFAAVPFEEKGGQWKPRYYQHNAITRAFAAGAKEIV